MMCASPVSSLHLWASHGAKAEGSWRPYHMAPLFSTHHGSVKRPGLQKLAISEVHKECSECLLGSSKITIGIHRRISWRNLPARFQPANLVELQVCFPGSKRTVRALAGRISWARKRRSHEAGLEDALPRSVRVLDLHHLVARLTSGRYHRERLLLLVAASRAHAVHHVVVGVVQSGATQRRVVPTLLVRPRAATTATTVHRLHVGRWLLRSLRLWHCKGVWDMRERSLGAEAGVRRGK